MRDGRIGAWAEGERVAEGHQIESVVSVEVGDRDRLHVAVIDPLTQLAEDTVAAVDQRRAPLVLE